MAHLDGHDDLAPAQLAPGVVQTERVWGPLDVHVLVEVVDSPSPVGLTLALLQAVIVQAGRGDAR